MMAGTPIADSQAGEAECRNPPYISTFTDVHYHPTVVIVLYKRNPDSSSPIHDVIALVTPGKGLGIDTNQGVDERIATRTRYRSIHAHDETGELHVEHNGSRSHRMCELLELWREQPKYRELIQAIVGGQLAHVRIGDEYRKNVPVDEMLQIPLNHGMPIFLFIETKTPL